MALVKTYVDANILIAAYRGKPDLAERMIAILDDPGRRFIVSSYLALETVPKPSFHSKKEEVGFMKAFLARAHRHIGSSTKTVENAISLACRYDLHPLDALHLSAAIFAKADEFLTLEKPDNPLCRAKEINVISLYKTT